MSRYIDADALFDAMEKTEWYNNADRDEIAERLIMDAPTIDIVRCSECKYYYNEDPEQIPTASIMCSHMHPDDFCSYGARKE